MQRSRYWLQTSENILSHNVHIMPSVLKNSVWYLWGHSQKADPLSQTSLSPSSVHLLVLFEIHIVSSCQTFERNSKNNNRIRCIHLKRLSNVVATSPNSSSDMTRL
jgi:hypothetical protein